MRGKTRSGGPGNADWLHIGTCLAAHLHPRDYHCPRNRPYLRTVHPGLTVRGPSARPVVVLRGVLGRRSRVRDRAARPVAGLRGILGRRSRVRGRAAVRMAAVRTVMTVAERSAGRGGCGAAAAPKSPGGWDGARGEW